MLERRGKDQTKPKDRAETKQQCNDRQSDSQSDKPLCTALYGTPLSITTVTERTHSLAPFVVVGTAPEPPQLTSTIAIGRLAGWLAGLDRDS